MATTVDPSVAALIAARWPGPRGDLLLALHRSHVQVPWGGVMPHRLVEGWFLGGTLPKGMRRMQAPALAPDDLARLLALHRVAAGGHGRASEMAAVLVNAFLWTHLFPEEFAGFSLEARGVFAFAHEDAEAFAQAASARDHVAYLLAFDLNALDSYRIATNRL